MPSNYFPFQGCACALLWTAIAYIDYISNRTLHVFLTGWQAQYFMGHALVGLNFRILGLFNTAGFVWMVAVSILGGYLHASAKITAFRVVLCVSCMFGLCFFLVAYAQVLSNNLCHRAFDMLLFCGLF